MKAPAKMGDAELDKAWEAAAEKANVALEAVRELNAEREARRTQADAQSSVDTMTESQREALLQVLAPYGVESQEAVNE